MLILGIDPGLRLTGYGVIDYRPNRSKLIDAGVIRLTVKAPLPDRLVVMAHGDTYWHGHPTPLACPEGHVVPAVGTDVEVLDELVPRDDLLAGSALGPKPFGPRRTLILVGRDPACPRFLKPGHRRANV